MTTFLLVRHGAHDRLGRFLDGRRGGVGLSAEGRAGVERLARRLAGERVDAVLSSPLERARETAAPLADALGLPVAVEEGLNEIDFGDWSGRTFDDLRPLDGWRQWNAARATAATPAGDTMRASQARVLDVVDRCRATHPEGAFVLVSHADPIKAALAYVLGLPLDALARFDVAPASLSRFAVEPWGARVELLNETVPA